MSSERIWQVRLPDGSAWIPPDSQPGPRASWIYARSTAAMFARELGGEVVEVTQRAQGKLLDKEIASMLSKPRSPRRLGRADRAARAAAILEYVNLAGAARAALDLARETADQAEYEIALGKLAAALPASLWVGHDERDRWMIQAAEPIWRTKDPAGEDPGAWRQIERAEIARSLVEDA